MIGTLDVAKWVKESLFAKFILSWFEDQCVQIDEVCGFVWTNPYIRQLICNSILDFATASNRVYTYSSYQ